MQRSRNPHALAVALIALALAGGVRAHSPAPETPAGHEDHAKHEDHSKHEMHADHSKHENHADHSKHDDHAKHENHADHAKQGAAAKPAEGVVVRLVDVPLVDQNERQVRLASDVIGDRIVVMDFVYTSCTTVCPVVSAIMGEVQAKLGARVGHDVGLVSISVDPVRDTPARLREFARTHGAGAGWTWLTGSSTAVNETLKGLGTWTPNFEDHPVVMMVGDGRSGEWTRFYGFADPAALVAKVEQLTAARSGQGAGK